ncbi:MAG TPA: FAD-linked oxidase, partial [Actinomycetes bacterium]
MSSHPAAIPIPTLRAELDGQVLTPDGAGYDQARTIFYGGFDQRPGAIVRPTDESGVAWVVTLARDSGLELAVRSGG